MNRNKRCLILLGGSFDPVHNGHVALGSYFSKLLIADELRVMPAGTPWQKGNLQASPAHRTGMVRRAFEHLAVPVHIDQREIQRNGATYTIDTLRALRAEIGPEASLVFLIGADQLQQLHTWKEWRQLFEYAHLCAASRPGFSPDLTQTATEAGREFARRMATPGQIRDTPHGLTYLASDLAIDISATAIRAAFARNETPGSLIPPTVLDYIKSHHLYET